MSEEFLSGLLEAEGVAVNLPEALLQLACQDGDHYTIPSDEREYALLNQRARGDCSVLHAKCVHHDLCCFPSSQSEVESHPRSDSKPLSISKYYQVLCGRCGIMGVVTS